MMVALLKLFCYSILKESRRKSVFAPSSLDLEKKNVTRDETKPIAMLTIKYENGSLLKDLMEWLTPPKSPY
ncbi:hypothetical protein H5410_033111, partial [Solanum commersonii]